MRPTLSSFYILESHFEAKAIVQIVVLSFRVSSSCSSSRRVIHRPTHLSTIIVGRNELNRQNVSIRRNKSVSPRMNEFPTKHNNNEAPNHPSCLVYSRHSTFPTKSTTTHTNRVGTTLPDVSFTCTHHTRHAQSAMRTAFMTRYHASLVSW